MMNDIGLAAPPIDNPITQLLEMKLAEARAGKIAAITIAWEYGPENGGFQNLGNLPLSMAGMCLKATHAWIDQAFQQKPSPIIRAVGDIPRSN